MTRETKANMKNDKPVSVFDVNEAYLQYTQDVIDGLEASSRREYLLSLFDEKGLAETIQGYEAIASALTHNELRVVRFVARKK